MRRLVYVVGASVDGFIAGPAGEVGGHLAGALLEEIDELVVKLHPVVAGAGVPLFAAPFTPTALALTGSRVLDRGTVVLTYDLRPTG